MIHLTDCEAKRLMEMLQKARLESLKPRQRRYKISNYCDKASTIIRRAERRQHKNTEA